MERLDLPGERCGFRFERIARRGPFALARGALGQVLRQALIVLEERLELLAQVGMESCSDAAAAASASLRAASAFLRCAASAWASCRACSSDAASAAALDTNPARSVSNAWAASAALSVWSSLSSERACSSSAAGADFDSSRSRAALARSDCSRVFSCATRSRFSCNVRASSCAWARAADSSASSAWSLASASPGAASASAGACFRAASVFLQLLDHGQVRRHVRDRDLRRFFAEPLDLADLDLEDEIVPVLELEVNLADRPDARSAADVRRQPQVEPFAEQAPRYAVHEADVPLPVEDDNRIEQSFENLGRALLSHEGTSRSGGQAVLARRNSEAMIPPEAAGVNEIESAVHSSSSATNRPRPELVLVLGRSLQPFEDEAEPAESSPAPPGSKRAPAAAAASSSSAFQELVHAEPGIPEDAKRQAATDIATFVDGDSYGDLAPFVPERQVAAALPVFDKAARFKEFAQVRRP